MIFWFAATCNSCGTATAMFCGPASLGDRNLWLPSLCPTCYRDPAKKTAAEGSYKRRALTEGFKSHDPQVHVCKRCAKQMEDWRSSVCAECERAQGKTGL